MDSCMGKVSYIFILIWKAIYHFLGIEYGNLGTRYEGMWEGGNFAQYGKCTYWNSK